LFDKAKSKFLADAVKKYETELKQLQIDKLNREKELQDQAIVKNQILIFSILGGLVVIMVFTVFLYRSFLKKKKANVIIEQKNVALEAAFSEIERQKNEIERISENEKRMNHLKLEFFTNISHEFRTPLSLIKAPAEKLITCETDPSRRELLRTIANNAGKLNMFVDQILDFRKLDAGTLTLYPVSDDVVKFVRQRFYSFTSLLETKHINMLFGAFNDSYTMAFDPRLLATSLDNILSNAFKYTSSQGTVTCAVELVGTEHDTLQVSITNTGKPIADEYLDKIFEPFFQVPGTVYGTGIGLALTREMMRLHQGHVTAKNIENAVCFSLLIPLEINVTQSSIDSSGQHQAVGDIMSSLIENTTTSHGEHEIEYKADHRKKTSKILIVEDNVELNHFLHEQLIDDYKVVCAFDGQTGIQMAKDKMPDLVISDVMMPVMNGLELCKELKTNELTSHLPVILLTAMTTEANVVNGFDTGADDYITKPFNLNELKARVANIIEQRQRLREKFSRNLISTEVSELATNKTDVQFLEKVMHVIESNIEDSSFGVPELASALAMSRQTLHDKMKKLSNESPGAFIQSARLKLAAKMLVSKAGNVTEIALATGFNDPTYFIRAFKKRFGVTPGEYKA
jgi:signal transduction histidine kinase/DNA-binding response OmpR family regulator